MIKHIVLFKLKNFATNEEKQVKEQEIKDALLALKDKIEVLKSIEVGINANPNEDYNIALTTSFESFDDLKTYAEHPDHQAVIPLIRAVLESRACSDYEV
ncbi:MAG: Dabb family protein [Chlorobi bacterium]|nr:Dabb family protein [Chlorobiota bacterium]